MTQMLWEQLVTDGHVRAARLRRIGPAFLLVAAILLCLGVGALLRPPRLEIGLYARNVLNNRVGALRQAVAQRLAQIAPLSLSPEEIKALPPTSALSDVLKRLRDSLKADPPALSAPFTALPDSAKFWSGEWPRGQIAYLESGDLKAFGAIVVPKPDNTNAYYQPPPTQPVRWLAIFRKTPNGWEDVALQGSGFVVPPGESVAPAQNLLLSLGTLMKLPEVP
jgi:hypothetical protein